MRKIKFQLLIIVVIVGTSVVLAIPRVLDFYQGYRPDGNPVCAYYNPKEFFYYYIVCMVWYLALPFLIMLVCSVVIIVTLKRKGSAVNKGDARRRRDRTLTVTLLAANIYFLIITLPFCIISIVDTYMRSFEPMFYYSHLKEYGVVFYTFVLPINFYHGTMLIVHIVFNKTFRKILKAFLFKHMGRNFLERRSRANTLSDRLLEV
jgi:hypothetical protein